MPQINALLKRLMSYTKREWDLDDYPIRVKQQKADTTDLGERFRPIAWSAQIVNWWQMSGDGDTLEEALSELRQRFERYREEHATLPRPGTGVPIEFASSDLVNQYEDIARDFLDRILHLNYDECFISDESSLWDFHGDETNDSLYRNIVIIYGVDVSDIDGAKLGAIFERIATARAS